MTVVVPAWLANWRAAKGVSVRDEADPGPTATTTVGTAPTPRVDSQGFTSPREWPYDECRRREPVLDHDVTPPRVIRRVGWQRCLRCLRPFFSSDIVRQRLCEFCKGNHS